ncbi:MAG: N-acetylneuraminate synthase [Filimonas sp.]|nr:N-acetylneuraminate synthase [Filimonas sp.]
MSKTLIIAEAGVNHNGDIGLAKELINAAVAAGADYVKFQTFKAEKLASKLARKASYQEENTNDRKESQYDMLKRLELSAEQHFELMNYARHRNIKFFSTAFDLDSVDFLSTLNLGLWKIPSGEITNYPYLKRIAANRQSVILSTGMCTMDDIRAAMNVLLQNGVDKELISVLHCNTQYPTPMRDVNLLAMLSIKREFGVNIGYSDHTIGIEIPIAAVALGATIIEKHFTLNRDMEGPDHKASLEPKELKEMVQAIRNVEMALGSPEKIISQSENENIVIARKSIVARTAIKKGDVFTDNNLTAKRPGTGISPMRWLDLLGKIATRDFNEDEQIEV